MTETAFTPGPWSYQDPMGPDILSIIANADAPPYAWVHIAQIGTDDDDGDDAAFGIKRTKPETGAGAGL